MSNLILETEKVSGQETTVSLKEDVINEDEFWKFSNKSIMISDIKENNYQVKIKEKQKWKA